MENQYGAYPFDMLFWPILHASFEVLDFKRAPMITLE
jgi:hypothetical protein